MRVARARLNAQVGTSARWIEKGAGRRPTSAIFLRRLIISETVLVAAVVVGIAREPLGDSGLDKSVANLGVLAQRGDVERAAAAPSVPAAARFIMLGFFEVWQNGVVRPTAVAELRPGVVVERIAAYIHHAVNRARTAEGLAAGDWDRAAVEVRFRLGGEPPIVARVVEEFREADGDVDPHRIVNRPCLQQQNLRAGIFGEPVSEHAAGGAGTDDDVVVVRHASLPLCLRPAKRLRGFSLLGRDYRQDDMRKAGRLRGAAAASVARLYSSVRCMSPDRACRGAPEGTRFACVPKQPGPRKAAMGIGLITVCDAAFSRCAARAGLSSRSSSYTSWHEGRRVLRSGGLAVFANTKRHLRDYRQPL